MKDRMKRLVYSDGFNNAASSIFAILIGLVFGFIILIISNPANAVEGLGTILLGGFTGGGRGVGQVLYMATPLLMTGLSVGFAFKTGLFNIGAPGQFIMGAVSAIYVGVHWTFLPGPLHWIVALICAAIMGAIWGLVPGLLKAYCNVHEVIATIMMNYIGMYMSNYIVKTTVFNGKKSISMDVAQSAELPRAGLDNIFYSMTGTFKETSTVNCGILIAIGFAIIMFFVINKTTFGYELKACGNNPDASKYAGINDKKNTVISMLIAGGLAGLGGGLLFLSGPSGRHMGIVEVLAAEGFNGIPVALLGLSNPIATIFTAFFVAYLTQGGSYLQSLNYMPEVINIIIACIIYFSAFSLLLRKVIPNIAKKLNQIKAAKGGEQ
ncbi:MAG: ABC transporter permease [Anaerovoracaceae bacterium]